MTDSGEGMDPETLPHIFEPFFTTKKPGFGTGLGLSIVHSIVAQSGGYINAHSQPHNGTTFEILFPRLGTFQTVSDVAEADRPGSGSVPTVLLVEDEDGVRRLMHSHLEREGYQLLEARNAEEAESIAEVYEKPIDVLVTDVVMPGASGTELAGRLQRLRPGLKILLISGYRHASLDPSALKPLNMLSKPFVPSELLRRVRLLLAQESHAVR